MAQSTLGIRLDEAIQARLKKLGQSRDRSPHYLMKEAIEAYLTQEEAVEVEKVLMAQRWETFELTGETISQDEITHWAASLAHNKPA